MDARIARGSGLPPAAASLGTGSASSGSPLSGSSFTGLGRGDWERVADGLLSAARRHASPGHARITPPGPSGRNGAAVDGLEGFARTFLLAGFRLAGAGGADPHDLAGWYARGIETGVDPASPERWVRLEEHPQAKVEAASLALVLDWTRPWIWDRLDPLLQERVVDYLAPCVGDATYPRINWVWFRAVVQTFLRSVGGPWSPADLQEDLASHDGFVRADGWLADGPERAFDHYTGWALHLYPVLWARMRGAADLAADRRARDVTLLDRYLLDALALVGADGSPLLQGRSLIYRFAAAAPFWVGALADVPSVPPGALRRAASGVLRHFLDHGVPDRRGLLSLGWHGPWPRLAQAYSGPASPYWAAKGMLGLALPADHPVWTAAEEPLPVERADTLRAVRAPGWLISGTRADGVVRVVNHGTDHAVEGSDGGDSPLYARLGYSTATAPLLDDAGWLDPLEQSVVLLDAAGRATHRTGMRLLGVAVQGAGQGRVGVAASVAAVHWLDADARRHDHGSGYTGVATPAGRLRVVSLVRGPWEVRLVTVEDLDPRVDAASLTLRVAGWPVAGDGDVTTARTERGCSATAGGLVSRLTALSPVTDAGVARRNGASPLGSAAAVPWVAFGVAVGVRVTSIVELAAHPPHLQTTGTVAIVRAGCGEEEACVTWPDGLRTRSTLPSRTAGTSAAGVRMRSAPAHTTEGE